MTATKRRPNLTEAEKQWAAQQRERHGWSHARIARKLGCSEGSVAWACLLLGADSPRAKPIETRIKGPLVVTRGGHQVRRFVPDEDAKLVAMNIGGKSDAEIARELGRRPNSIRARLATLARHEARNETRAS